MQAINQIRVRGFSVQFKLQNLQSPGRRYVAYIRFTSPQHASDVILDGIHDLKIKWQSFIADSNETGNLLSVTIGQYLKPCTICY
jgi:hypothetical protein